MGVAERFAMRRFDVEQLKYQSAGGMQFDSDTIDELLNDFETRHRNWLVTDERLEEMKMLWSAIPNETVDVFRMFILVSGFNLEGYGKALPKKVEKHKQYQLEVYLCSDYILGIAIHDADMERPYYKETYAPVICATTATTAVMIRPSVISPYALVTDARWAACTCSRL